MASTYVKISDIIEPEVFSSYVIEATREKSALFTSGLLTMSAEMDALARQGGRTFNMPMFRDLDSSEQSVVLSDTTPLETRKITTAQSVGICNYRGTAFASHDLAGELAGADPLAAIASRLATWWARDMQRMTLSVLDGVFGALAAAGSPHVVDKTHATTPTDDNRISAVNIIDAFSALGDAGDDLATIIMHSNTYWSLVKQDLITFEPYSQQDARIPRFLGRPVIVDDGMPTSGSGATKKYTVYLFAGGQLAYGEGAPREPVEVDRDILAGTEYLVNRKSFIVHPVGMSWVGTPAGTSPTNAEFATAGNWSQVYEDKAISMVKLLVNP